jgi:hypothetical protein
MRELIKKIIFLFTLLIFTSKLYADFGTDYYYIKGKAYNSSGVLMKNEFLILKQGEYFRLFKTDYLGNFIVKVPFLLPCLSGRPAPKSKYDTKSVMMVEHQNGNNIDFIPLDGKGIFETKEIWRKYYFNDSINIENRIETIEIRILNKEFQTNHSISKYQQYEKDRSILFNFLSKGNIKLPEVRHYLFESLLDFVECRNLTKEEVVELLGIPKESKVIQNFTNKFIVFKVEKELYRVRIITVELILNNNVVIETTINHE